MSVNREALQEIFRVKRGNVLRPKIASWERAGKKVSSIFTRAFEKRDEILEEQAAVTSMLVPCKEHIVKGRVQERILEMAECNAGMRDAVPLRDFEGAKEDIIGWMGGENEFCRLFGDRDVHVRKANRAYKRAKNSIEEIIAGEKILPLDEGEMRGLMNALLAQAEEAAVLSRDIAHVLVSSLLLGVDGPEDLQYFAPLIGSTWLELKPEEYIAISGRTVPDREEVAWRLLEFLYPDDCGELISEVLPGACA